MGGDGFAGDEGQNILKNLLSKSLKLQYPVIFNCTFFSFSTHNWLFLEVCSFTYEFKPFLRVNRFFS